MESLGSESKERLLGGKIEILGEVIDEEGGRDSSSSSDCLVSEVTVNEEQSRSSSSEGSSSTSSSSTPQKGGHLENGRNLVKQDNNTSSIPEIEMMKERFAKLLLGEDMSGCGNGVSTALAISNAITNLCATVFGQLWTLEPLPYEKKRMWKREMELLLCVSDHIVEMTPTWQIFPDGTKLEIMTCRPRSDLCVNLPALRKLDNMLLEILDSFHNTEFWYVDQGIVSSETTDGSCSFRRQLQRQEEKWWLPVPRVPHAGGLQEETRKNLQHKRDSTNQILKAAMAINSMMLADMDVPQSFMDNLPKNGRASLGDVIYRYITSDQFSTECLLDCLDLSSEHQAIEIANRVEASIYLWRQKTNSSKPNNGTRRSASRSSWDMVKELMIDVEKRELLADRAEGLLLSLKQRFPGLPQTNLDMSKIQYNKDVGKSILESYSRVLESLAFNIVARIDDLLYVDDLTKHSDIQQYPSISRVSMIAHKPVSIQQNGSIIMASPGSGNTPYKTAVSTPSIYSSPMKSGGSGGERSPFLSTSSKLINRGFGVKKVLTDYLSTESPSKAKDCGMLDEKSESSVSNRSILQASKTLVEIKSPVKDSIEVAALSPDSKNDLSDK